MNVNMNQENMNENLRILSEMSEEELNTVLAQVSSLVKKMAHNDGQLTEEDLEQVAGGVGILGIAGVAAVHAATYLVTSWFTGGQASYHSPFDAAAMMGRELKNMALNVANTAATVANNISSGRGLLDDIL